MKKVAFGLALFGAFVAGGVLMNSMLLQADEKPEPRPRGQLYPKWKELGLAKEQVDKIYKIQSDHRAQIDKLEAQIKTLKAKERAEAEKILTPAQKARLKELLSGSATEPDKDKVAKPPEKDKKPN